MSYPLRGDHLRRAYDRAAVRFNGREAVTHFDSTSYDRDVLPETENEDSFDSDLVTGAFDCRNDDQMTLSEFKLQRYGHGSERAHFKDLDARLPVGGRSSERRCTGRGGDVRSQSGVCHQRPVSHLRWQRRWSWRCRRSAASAWDGLV
ncbi:uncharacterized protein LOC100825522 isoform X2 [Brachypodium distachyon]|uniref:uncharacterized protein LOC100825522 isoform X2 n=1 Tax=Brachypodium distachyon TaxID=15368 RepID=UPI00052FDFB6|nr:uncharacterized protein LOC100825522 isoform X2 [Brachypodium distachyon]XP_010234580.1 uncharacterized protein LOC100825522 isoform X2 [Brachypodium distachyon]|eukprot:XP_010234579.1 uncharacterized protein LOC100825522 isoform X2 [Brachypodium distachyon]